VCFFLWVLWEREQRGAWPRSLAPPPRRQGPVRTSDSHTFVRPPPPHPNNRVWWWVGVGGGWGHVVGEGGARGGLGVARGSQGEYRCPGQTN